jgi:hypothetical protein
MRIVDEGHVFGFHNLDGPGYQWIHFVKREGSRYPGNIGSHPGTTSQEVLRGLINRAEYVNKQIPAWQTRLSIWLYRIAIWLYENRAAKVHGRRFSILRLKEIESLPACSTCGHIECKEHGQFFTTT